MYQQIMKDPLLEKQLSQDGFLVIKNFFAEDRVKDLLQYFYNTQTTYHAEHIINSVWHSSDVNYRKNTMKKIVEAYDEPCQRYFVDYKLVGSSFVIKPPHGKGASYPHIDYAIVDEDVHRAYSLWIPLVNLTKENGPLQVMRASHTIKKVFRGPNIPDPVANIHDFLWLHSEAFLLNAGDLIIYDYRLVHCSRENFSNEPRVAVSSAIIASNASMMLHFWDEETQKVFGYEVDTEYMMQNTNKNPKGILTPAKEWNASIAPLSVEDFDSILAPKAIWHKLLAMLKG